MKRAMLTTLRVRGWSLRAYFLLLVLLFVAAAGGALVYLERESDADAKRTALADARFAARKTAAQLDQDVLLARATTGQLAANPKITQAFVRPAGCSLTFEGVAGHDRSHLDIIRADGRVACSSAGRRAASYAGSPWFHGALSRPVLAAPVRDRATGALVVLSTSPLPAGKGVVAAFVDLAPVGPYLASSFSGGHPFEFLVTGRDGRTVVARSVGSSRWVGAQLRRMPLVAGASHGDGRDPDGVSRHYARSTVPSTGWQVFAGEPMSAVLATRLVDRRQLVIIGLTLVAILLMVWLVYGNLVRPLRRLSAAVRRSAGRPSPLPIPISGPIELTALSKDINALVASVNRELEERRRAEEEALVSEQNYRLLFQANPNPMWVYDAETLRFLAVNEATVRNYGYSREEFLGMTILDIRPAAEVPHLRTVLESLDVDRTLNESGVWRHARKDGTTLDVEVTSQSHVFEGHPARVVLATDVTERIRGERALRHLAAIVASSHEAIVGRDLEGVVTSWNRGAERLFGYTAEEMIGRSVAILSPDGEGELQAINETLRTGEKVEFEAVRIRKDGTQVEVASTISPIAGASGEIVGASSISRGIGERKQAEAALRTSEARYRDLFENATDLIATVDLDSRLTAVNESFLRTLGYTRDELLGRPLRELVPEEWHEQLERARVGKLGDHESTVYEHELIAKDGSRVQVEVASRLIEEDGRPIGVEAICRNISERRLLEDQLRQAQRLEAVGRLAGGVAHDFNNLLTVISGYAEALIDDSEPGTASEELREIAAAADRATVLTRQLLAFSRRQVLQPSIVNLNEIVEGIMPMITRLIGEDIDVVTSLDPDLDRVSADPNQIEQVLLNLVINARDAMPTGGKLTIVTSNADLDESYVAEHTEAHLGAHATLSVTDDGIGMDSDTLARVFEPFFTTKGVGTGTGLGLSTVYGIVKQSGGNVWVYSEPGHGSTFKVYLPSVAETADPTLPVRPAEAGPGGTETILIVEDEDAVRTLAAGMLGKRGYSVLATGSAAEAIRLADMHNGTIRLLLTDLVMPEMSGRELASRITARNPSLRVLFMSGYADEAVTRGGELDPGAAFIEKPFSANDLARQVRRTLDGPERRRGPAPVRSASPSRA